MSLWRFLTFAAPTLNLGSFLPTDIDGLQLWLKADSLSLSDDDPVATWSDSSGQGNDATQGTEANRPLYKTGIVNGKPVVRFDGTNDALVSSFTAIAQPTTVIVVVYIGTAEGDNDYVYDSTNAAQRHGFLMDTAATPDGYHLHAGVDYKPGDALPKTTWFISSIVWNGASTVIYEDGATIGTGNAGTGQLDGMTIGARHNGAASLNGDIAEVIVYDSALSDADRESVESYLATKYNITLS